MQTRMCGSGRTMQLRIGSQRTAFSGSYVSQSRVSTPDCKRQAAARAQAEAEAAVAVGETYEVTLPKPLGVRFGRGNDGAAYVTASDETLGNTDDRIQVADKVKRVSASFGDDIWEAKNYGQVTYAVKTRNGAVYMELESRGGDMAIFKEKELTEAEKRFNQERAGGNYGAGTKELQARNYIARKENERKRKEMFEDALEDFRAGKIEDALYQWEEVKDMEPRRYIGPNMATVTRIKIVTLYNIACCYSSLKQGDAAMEAMKECMECGFDEYKKIYNDKNLEYMRSCEGWDELVKQYDEPILNENAVNAVKNLWAMFKRDK